MGLNFCRKSANNTSAFLTTESSHPILKSQVPSKSGLFIHQGDVSSSICRCKRSTQACRPTSNNSHVRLLKPVVLNRQRFRSCGIETAKSSNLYFLSVSPTWYA